LTEGSHPRGEKKEGDTKSDRQETRIGTRKGKERQMRHSHITHTFIHSSGVERKKGKVEGIKRRKNR